MKRRDFNKIVAAAGISAFIPWRFGARPLRAQIPGGTLSPLAVPKWAVPLVKPPAFAPERGSGRNKNKDRYDIAVRQFQQQILSAGPTTPVWSYGPGRSRVTDLANGYFYPAFTVENTWNMTTQVLWRNELVDAQGNFLPHLLPVDQTLHWANPPGGMAGRDGHGSDPAPYLGPVPIVTHVHGAHTNEDSDGYPEAWYLPRANNIPAGYATTGTFYDYFNTTYGKGWGNGTVSFKYPNDQPATTLWYHDHTLGMTRVNVYAGPAGFWLIRGGPNDMDLGYVAPTVGDNPFGEYTEIPIAIQDRSFNTDGTLFYPADRAFFEGLAPSQLQIPFTPTPGCDGLPSDISPIWNPEFFGNMMVVNGRTWPYLNVQQRRYRFRLLNGCNSRFLVLKMTTAPRGDNNSFNAPEYDFVQIGADQGFLSTPLLQSELLMAPAERADVVVDFTNVAVGTEIYLVNDGPDAPFGGIGLDDISDFESTGLVMKFIVGAATNPDTTADPLTLTLPAAAMPGAASVTRALSLNEMMSTNVRVVEDAFGNIVQDCANGEEFGPQSALLGTHDPGTGVPTPLMWMAGITENPAVGATETWELYNFTADAHPIHIHQTHFQVVNREDQASGVVRGPEPWETGYKDTVIAYPGEITRVKALYDLPGYYVWHCHIVEHEDNEMMRPMHVGPIPANGPAQ